MPASIENPKLTSLVDKLLDILKKDKGTKLHFTQNECSTTEFANFRQTDINCALKIMQKQGSHKALPKQLFKKVNGMF